MVCVIRTLSALMLLGIACACTHNDYNTMPQGAPSLAQFRIAFGSCAKERLPMPLWDDILAKSPDTFLFIGDNAYADVFVEEGKVVRRPVKDPARFYEAYQTLAAEPHFANFRRQVPILATWDDHDYGANDQGKEYPLKQESQKAFADFFAFPPHHPIHDQAGVYHSKMLGNPGQELQIILLDTRYHRDQLNKLPQRPKNKGPYIPHTATGLSVLGERQWEWLEKELLKPAQLRIIVSSVQLVAYEHGWESWGLFPQERQRLYDLIAQTKANGVVFVSGDRHLMELSVDSGQLGSRVPYPIWDFTASGINESFAEVEEGNTFRRGPVHRRANYGLLTVSLGKKAEESVIKFEGFGDDNVPLISESLSLGELRIAP